MDTDPHVGKESEHRVLIIAVYFSLCNMCLVYIYLILLLLMQ